MHRRNSISLADNTKIAFRSIRGNLMRSALTMLGIVIGVAAVILMVAIGSGAHRKVTEEIRSLGSNVLIVQPGAQRTGGVRQKGGSEHTLTEQDASAIRSQIPGVEAASPVVSGSAQAIHGNRNWATVVAGVTPGYFVVRDWSAPRGRLFNQDDVKNANKVAVIGQKVAENLFATPNVLGTTIRIDRTPFTVVGILEKIGQSPGGLDQDDAIYVPISTAKRRLMGGGSEANRHSVHFVLVKASRSDLMGWVTKEIESLIRQRHRTFDPERDDFRVSNLATILSAREETSKVFGILLASIAAVSLLVGGIGIMNIMLVSVTERTREIGLRRALGADSSDIRNQFLVESCTLCLLGGCVGILIGIPACFLVAKIGNWPVLVDIRSVVLAFGVSTLIGIIFGLYPALKASRQNPITALRFE